MTVPETLDTEQKASRPKTVTVSAVTFAIVILLTAFFAYRNHSLDADIAAENTRIAGYDASIEALGRDPDVQAMDLLSRNKAQIEKAVARADVARYVRELDALRTQYSVGFSGFKFASDVVSTTLVATRTPLSEPVAKITKFIADYRDGTASGSFNLAPVSAFPGNGESRSFGIQFNVK